MDFRRKKECYIQTRKLAKQDYTTHMAGSKRYHLSLFNVSRSKIDNIYKAYYDTQAETIEEIIAELAHFVSEVIIFYPELIFDNEENRNIRKELIGFGDNATGGYVRYKLGDLIDAYIKKLIVDAIPEFDDFELGVSVDGKR